MKVNYKVSIGTLWRHNNGTYYARWQDRGRNRRKTLGTKDEIVAKRRFRKFQRDLIAGKIESVENLEKKFFFEFVVEHLDFVAEKLEPPTHELYKVAYDKAKSCWGNVPLRRITTKHIDSLIVDMSKGGLAVTTINKNIRHIKAGLNKAYEWNYLKSPIRFPKPQKENEKLRFLTKDELRLLLAKVEDIELFDFFLLSAYTGLRISEILRLNKSDVDNPEDFLRIVSKQKNKEESRIPINQHARVIIERCLNRSANREMLFRWKSRSWVTRLFKRHAIKAGLNDARFHDLRHTFGSHLAMSGESGIAIQELMRHQDPKSTQVYTKVSPDYLKQASNSLNYGPMPVGKKNAKK